MTFALIIKKIFSLLKKINNPPFFWYSVFHYIKKDYPIRLAIKVSKKNLKSYLKEENEFILHTYDGSNQLVHPDILFYDNKYWFVATPYPYGMEEYENPCLYVGEGIHALKEFLENPIDRQSKHEIGFHLSDPCIFEYNCTLHCAYRENVRKNRKEVASVYYKSLIDNDQWSDKKLIIQSDNDFLLSPAFYSVKSNNIETLIMLHVNKGILIKSIFDNNMQIERTEFQTLRGLPHGYYMWHISVSFDSGRKIGNTDEVLSGLFLLRNMYLQNDFKLFTSVSNTKNEWKILREVAIPDAIKRNELHPYKSCFIPNSKGIMYSYIDRKHRYRMTTIDNSFILE